MILITTSRKPSKNTRVFARRLSCLLPLSEYTPRGKKSISELAELSVSKGFRKIIVIQDKKGNPSKLQFLEISKDNWEWADEIEIKSVSLKQIKERQKEVFFTDKKLAKIFLIEPIKEADVEIKTNKNEIIFILNNEEVMKIKTGEF